MLLLPSLLPQTGRCEREEEEKTREEVARVESGEL